jgi:MFS transporter, DHA1 family, multidrug resistance protein
LLTPRLMNSASPFRVVSPLGLAVCLSLLGDLTLYAVLVTQLDVLGLSLASVGVLLSVNRLVRIPGNLVAGVLFDRWGRRPLFLLGMVLGVLSTAGYGLARGFWPFLLARATWGVAWTLINIGGRTIALDVSSDADRGRVTGFYQAWMWAGFALGPLLGGILTDRIGFRPTMLILAALTAVGLAVALLAVPETMQRGQRPGIKTRAPAKSARKAMAGALQSGLSFLRATPALVFLAALLLITQFTGEGIATSTLTLWLQSRFGQTVALDGIMLGIATAGGIVAAAFSILAGVAGPAAGHLSDRYGRLAVIVGSLIMAILGFVRLAAGGSMAAFALGVVLLAVSSGAALAALIAQAGDLTPPGRQGTVMGLLATVSDLGLMLGPIVAFGLLPTIGLSAVYGMCILACTVGLGLAWWQVRHSTPVVPPPDRLG